MVRQKKEEAVKQTVNVKRSSVKRNYIFTVGRRKSSVARVRLYKDMENLSMHNTVLKKGDIFVNEKPIDDFFTLETERVRYKEPLRITNALGKYIFTIKVIGGGRQSQAGAIVHGISRALSELDTEKLRPILKKKGFLTRDPRVRQRRQVGMGGKSRRKRQSPKR